MKKNTHWNQDWMQDADGSDMMAQSRQTELVPDARLDSSGTSSRSLLARLTRRLLHMASITAMSLQFSQLSF